MVLVVCVQAAEARRLAQLQQEQELAKRKARRAMLLRGLQALKKVQGVCALRALCVHRCSHLSLEMLTDVDVVQNLGDCQMIRSLQAAVC